MSIKTPFYSLKQFPSVYEPSEDTFLLIDALEQEYQFLKELEPTFVVEIGSGSGIIISALHSILKNSCIYFSTDINPQACLATKETAGLNSADLNVCQMDLLSKFKCNSLFDVIIFNPPYVPTDCSEIESGVGLNRSWAGGANGRQIIDDLLPQIADFLSLKGVFYLLCLQENKPLEIVDYLIHKCNFKDVCIIKERRIIGEHLFVIKCCK